MVGVGLVDLRDEIVFDRDIRLGHQVGDGVLL
jgi:hypothetical protein